jgi:hypothetical protein
MSKGRELSDYLDDDPMQIILADPGFRDSLLATMASGPSPVTKAFLRRKRSVFLGQFVELGQREDRAVLADVIEFSWIYH